VAAVGKGCGMEGPNRFQTRRSKGEMETKSRRQLPGGAQI
jgi:hypothetical protein